LSALITTFQTRQQGRAVQVGGGEGIADRDWRRQRAAYPQFVPEKLDAVEDIQSGPFLPVPSGFYRNTADLEKTRRRSPLLER